MMEMLSHCCMIFIRQRDKFREGEGSSIPLRDRRMGWNDGGFGGLL